MSNYLSVFAGHKHSLIRLSDSNLFKMCMSNIVSVFYVGVFGCLSVWTGTVPAVELLMVMGSYLDIKGVLGPWWFSLVSFKSIPSHIICSFSL